MDHHRWWLQAYRLDSSMWGVNVHKLAMRAIQHGGCYDGIELCNLASIEDILREAQMVEYVYLQEANSTKAAPAGKKGQGRGRGQAGLVNELEVFTGTHRDSGETMVCPELSDYVAKELERDAGVMKQIRKSREEKALLLKNQPETPAG